jgi:hypothetical protein
MNAPPPNEFLAIVNGYHVTADCPRDQIRPSDPCFVLRRRDGTELARGLPWAAVLELIRRDQESDGDARPAHEPSPADEVRRLAADVERDGVTVERLVAYLTGRTGRDLVEPPAAVRVIAASLTRLFTGLPADGVAGFLRSEADRLDRGE